MQVWSNDEYESVEHRVKVNPENINSIPLQSITLCCGEAFREAD